MIEVVPDTDYQALHHLASISPRDHRPVPIVVDKNHVIVAGHTRMKAAEKPGLTEVPVFIATDLTPEQVQAYRIADNKTGEIAQWNYELLPRSKSVNCRR